MKVDDKLDEAWREVFEDADWRDFRVACGRISRITAMFLSGEDAIRSMRDATEARRSQERLAAMRECIDAGIDRLIAGMGRKIADS
jgi:hypothetical protein